jgi:D-arabinose 1-dehydrogenase-like Zn-dependent alcohol dehydrogenase
MDIRGLPGTRQDMAEALEFAAQGKVGPLVRRPVGKRADDGARQVKCITQSAELADINAIYSKVRSGKVNGRIVLDLTKP